MKLAIVRSRYNPFGGAERFIERALAPLAASGLAITLVTRAWRSGDEAPYELLICNPPYLGRLSRDVGFARCVRSRTTAAGFDLVQSHERIPGCSIYRAGDGVHASWVARRARVDGWLARIAIRLSPWHRYVLAAEARLFRDPALRRVVCNANMVADDIRRRFGVPEDKLTVIYNAVDGEHFHPGLRVEHRARVRAELGVAASSPVAIFVGSGFRRKGVGTLLRAAAGVPELGVWIVGADRRTQSYRRLAARLGLTSRVRFLGPCADVRPYLAAADLFALPTLYDPMPNAALEAMACGLPVLTTPGSGAAELIADGRNGYVLDALDVGAWSDCLHRLSAPGVAASMGPAARAAVAELDPQTMAARWLTLYRELLPAGSG